MGVRLLALMALLIGVLYGIHILVQDYQAITAPRLLRLLFKRDLNYQNSKPSVRWKRILFHDPIQCARYLYCDLGARPADNEVRQGFILMLTLEPLEADRSSLEVFNTAYNYGRTAKEPEDCNRMYPMCPVRASLLFDVIQYLLRNNVKQYEAASDTDR